MKLTKRNSNDKSYPHPPFGLVPLKGRQCFLVSFVLRDSALSLFKGDEPEGRVGVTLIVAILFS